MKIAVVCANGKAGKLIVSEAVARGFDVTAFVRGDNKTVAQKAVIKDLFEITKTDLADIDIVIDAFGMNDKNRVDEHSRSLNKLCDLLSQTNTRLLIIGGAGSLFIDKEHMMTLAETPDFPEPFKPVANAMGNALKELRQRTDVQWTYISPAAEFIADGEKTGSYVLAGEEFTVNSQGRSFISYADYAIAMIDEAASGKHIQQRVSTLTKA